MILLPRPMLCFKHVCLGSGATVDKTQRIYLSIPPENIQLVVRHLCPRNRKCMEVSCSSVALFEVRNKENLLLMVQKSGVHQLIWQTSKHPIIYRVLYIPGGWEWDFFHQQYQIAKRTAPTASWESKACLIALKKTWKRGKSQGLEDKNRSKPYKKGASLAIR